MDVTTAALEGKISITEAKKILEDMGQKESGPYAILIAMEGKPEGVIEDPEENTEEN